MKRLTKFTRYQGNAYYAGNYQDNYLPKALLNIPELVVDLNRNSDQKVEVNVDNQFRLDRQTVNIGAPEKSINSQLSFKDGAEVVEVKDKESKPNRKETEDKKIINLNTATLEELNKISSFVTVAIAQNIVKARGENKIENLEDLTARVALKGKNTWASVSEKIEF